MIRSQITIAATSARETSRQVLQRLLAGASFDEPSPSDMHAFESSNWLTRTVAKGSSIVGQDEDAGHAYVLLSGWAFRYQMLPDGKRQILDFVLPGALLGFGSAGRNWYGVETTTDCRVASLPVTKFKRLLAACPSIAICVAERLSDGERLAHEHVTSLGRRSSRERIAAFIVELAARTGAAGTSREPSMLELPVTQVMIADALGLANETVCRTLGKLADSGLIAAGRNWLQLLDLEALAWEAGMDGDSFTGAGQGVPVAA